MLCRAVLCCVGLLWRDERGITLTSIITRPPFHIPQVPIKETRLEVLGQRADSREIQLAERKARRAARQARLLAARRNNTEFVMMTRSEPRIPKGYERAFRIAEAEGAHLNRMGSAWDLTASDDEIRNVRFREALAPAVLPDADMIARAATDEVLDAEINAILSGLDYVPPNFPKRPEGPFEAQGGLVTHLQKAYAVYKEVWPNLSDKQKLRALGLMIVEDQYNRGRDDAIKAKEDDWNDGTWVNNVKSYVVGFAYDVAAHTFDKTSPTHLVSTGMGHIQGFLVAKQLGRRYFGFSKCQTIYPVTPCSWSFYMEEKVRPLTHSSPPSIPPLTHSLTHTEDMDVQPRALLSQGHGRASTEHTKSGHRAEVLIQQKGWTTDTQRADAHACSNVPATPRLHMDLPRK